VEPSAILNNPRTGRERTAFSESSLFGSNNDIDGARAPAIQALGEGIGAAQTSAMKTWGNR
jgi:hypothetical protein